MTTQPVCYRSFGYTLQCACAAIGALSSIHFHLSQNAGINSPQVPIEEVSLETFQSVINVNLIGTFLCTREAVKIFKSQTPQGGMSGTLEYERVSPHTVY